MDPSDLRTSKSLPTPITVEPLLPLASLTDEARVRLRARRDKILHQLEEEEKLADLAQRRREIEEREVFLHQIKEEAAKERERLKEARELQKKMGRALLLNVSKAREKERQEETALRLRDEEADKDRKRSPPIKKKMVAFAEHTEQIETNPDSSSSTDWGDVIPGQLIQRKRPTLLSQALLDKHPMKLNVVERMPSRRTSHPTRPADFDDDSDNDSEPRDAPDSSDNEEDEPSLEMDDIDFNTAQHEREVALQYYTMRTSIEKEAAQTLVPAQSDSHVSTEVLFINMFNIKPSFQNATQNLSQETSQPEISNRLASAYLSDPSSSLCSTVVPPSSVFTIQQSIRTGKLDSTGHLIGRDDDSASETEAEGLQDVLDLIRKGEICNVGPKGEYIPNSQHSEDLTSSNQSAGSSAQRSGSLPFQSSTLPAPSMRSKTSKFKASRATAGRPSPASLSLPMHDTPFSSGTVTPVSYDNRSSPKLDTPTMPVMIPTVGERTRPAASPVHSPKNVIPAAKHDPPNSLFSMTIDSPSFPAYSTPAMSPMIIESPSYPHHSSRPVLPPTILRSEVVESSARPGLQSPKQSTPVVRGSYPAPHQRQSSAHEQDQKQI